VPIAVFGATPTQKCKTAAVRALRRFGHGIAHVIAVLKHVALRCAPHAGGLTRVGNRSGGGQWGRDMWRAVRVASGSVTCGVRGGQWGRDRWRAGGGAASRSLTGGWMASKSLTGGGMAIGA